MKIPMDISLSHSSIDFSSFLVNSLIHILIILLLLMMMMSICILILISIGIFMGLVLFLMMITFDLIHNGTIKCWILCGQIFQILQNINQFISRGLVSAS